MSKTTPEPKNVIYGLFHVDDPDRIRYVGLSSRGLDRRLREHKRDSVVTLERPVYKWIRKHGGDSVSARVLAAAERPDALPELESTIIEELRLRGSADLNMTDGGEGTFGYFPPPEVREKMSASRRGERSAHARVTEATVAEFKRQIWGGLPIRDACALMGLTRTSGDSISRGASWEHVPWPIGPRCTPAARGVRVRNQSGDANPASKLTDDQVAEIKSRLWDGENGASIAKDYPTSAATVSQIKRGDSWTSVPWPSDRPQTIRSQAERMSTLSDDVVREVRRLKREEGLGALRISRRLPVSQAQAERILSGDRYTHVPEAAWAAPKISAYPALTLGACLQSSPP